MDIVVWFGYSDNNICVVNTSSDHCFVKMLGNYKTAMIAMAFLALSIHFLFKIMNNLFIFENLF